MAKIFATKFNLPIGPCDTISSLKNIQFSLKNFHNNIYSYGKVKLTGNGNGTLRDNITIGDKCKDMRSTWSVTEYRVIETLSLKEYAGKTEDPPFDTPPPTIFELMLGYAPFGTVCKVKYYFTRYRETYSVGRLLKTTEIDCYKDYNEEGEKVSDSPDTNLYDSRDEVEFIATFNEPDAAIDPLTLNVFVNRTADIYAFGGLYAFPVDESGEPNGGCVIPKSNYSYMGKVIKSGATPICGAVDGNANFTVSFSRDYKLKLFPP